jgi:hypothetical protein
MNRPIQVLMGALVVQVVLAAVTWLPGSGGSTPKQALIAIPRDSITELDVATKPEDGATATPVKLVKEAAGWVIASEYDYPADATKVDAVLDKLTAVQVGDPIATSAASLDALKVGDTDYGRQVTVTGGGQTASLIVGGGSGNSTHVRRAGETAAYDATGFSEWSISDSARGYWNPKIVDVDPATIASVTVTRTGLPDLVFHKEGDDWTIDGLPVGQAPDGEKIGRIVGQLASVRITDVKGAAPTPDEGFEAGLRVSFGAASGATLPTSGYKVGKVDGPHTYVQTDEQPFVAEVAKATWEKLRTVGPEEWMATASSAPAPGLVQGP